MSVSLLILPEGYAPANRSRYQLLRQAKRDFDKNINANVFETERSLYPYVRVNPDGTRVRVRGYNTLLGNGFIRDLYRLTSNDTWLDVGKGVASARYDGPAKCIVVTASKEDTVFPDKLRRLHKNPNPIQFFRGRRLEEFGDEEISVTRLSDVNAAATYSINVGETVQKMLGIMQVMGRGYIATRDPFVKIIDQNHEPVDFLDWLEMGDGVTVDRKHSMRRKDLLPPALKTEALRTVLGEEPVHVHAVFDKLHEGATVIPLELVSWTWVGLGIPAGRTFEVQTP